MEVIHVISHFILIISFFHDDGEIVKDRIHDVYPNISIYAPIVIWILFFIFNCIALLLLGQLYIFHTLLQQRNLTTYEHIVQEYRNQRTMSRRMNELEAERSESIIRAQSQQLQLKVLQLQVGRFCRQIGLPYCDILRLPPEPVEPDPEAGFANIFGNTNHNVDDDGDDYDNTNNNHVDLDNNEHYELGNDEVVEITDYNEYNDGNENQEVSDVVDKNDTCVDVDDDDDDDNNNKNRNNNNDTDVDRSQHSSSSKQKPQQEREIVIHNKKKRLDYVELTMSGQNDYANNNVTVVVNNDDNDNNNVEYNTVTINDSNNSNNLDMCHSNYDDEDNMDNDDEVDGIFIENDDRSYKSGCSGRSYRSGRSGRSSKSGKPGKLINSGTNSGEQDLTAF
jgi:hypothetical protein